MKKKIIAIVLGLTLCLVKKSSLHGNLILKTINK